MRALGIGKRAKECTPTIALSAQQLRQLKRKQEKLQEDPTFVEKIAREDLNYAKPGETIFRFVDEEKP